MLLAKVILDWSCWYLAEELSRAVGAIFDAKIYFKHHSEAQIFRSNQLVFEHRGYEANLATVLPPHGWDKAEKTQPRLRTFRDKWECDQRKFWEITIENQREWEKIKL